MPAKRSTSHKVAPSIEHAEALHEEARTRKEANRGVYDDQASNLLVDSLVETLLAVPRVLDESAQLGPDLYRRLVAIGKARHMTQIEISERMGRDPHTVSKWLSGQHEPTIATLHQLAAAVGVAIEIRLIDVEQTGALPPLLNGFMDS